MTRLRKLEKLTPGMLLLVGGDQLLEVSDELASRFQPGDTLCVVPESGEVLHLPQADRARAEVAVSAAQQAFAAMRQVDNDQISKFYDLFAASIADDSCWEKILEVNRADVAEAQARGRSTTRLRADDKLRANVIAGLRGWANASSQRGRLLETVQHDGWVAELIGAELGVVGFVFEGRPNVVADATGVLRGGNTVVFRIGRDALGTARAMLELALVPALLAAGLPRSAVSLVDSPTHASGWAMFSDPRLSLAVARGSGPAVATLGSLARAAGVPVSLHGTGGAWVMLGASASAEQVEQVVFRSLDRKVCNTLNTLCIHEAQLEVQLAAAMNGLQRAAESRGRNYKLHVLADSAAHLPKAWFRTTVAIQRAEGSSNELQAEVLAESELSREWEWEESPEITLLVRPKLDDSIALFNRYSPQFVASLLSQNRDEHEHFYRNVNAPFVGDGFTRWVDGQFALRKPELGLSNWEKGRLLGRGGVLSGDSVFTVRTRVRST